MLSIIRVPQEPSALAITGDNHALSPVDEIMVSFRPQNWLALILGGCVGSFVPISVWTLIAEINRGGDWRLWFLVIGGMAFSAISVARWAYSAFGGGLDASIFSAVKSLGFCLLLDGSMAFSHTKELSLVALVLLAVINSISCATHLQSSRDMQTDSTMPSVTPSITPAVNVTVNALQSNVTPPERPAPRSQSRVAPRKAAAERSRRYRERKRLAESQTVTMES